MCTHRGPGDVEDCILTPDRVTGALVCVQHSPPIPRQRDDELDVIVPTIQAEAVEWAQVTEAAGLEAWHASDAWVTP